MSSYLYSYYMKIIINGEYKMHNYFSAYLKVYRRWDVYVIQTVQQLTYSYIGLYKACHG